MSVATTAELAASRAEIIARALKRFRLVYVQLGTAFEPLRPAILSGIGARAISVKQLMAGEYEPAGHPEIEVTDLEKAILEDNEVSLGALRENVIKRVDAGQSVCLLSRAPRCAYAAIPGSSILEDCAFVTVPLLSAEERGREVGPKWARSWRLPCVELSDGLNLDALLTQMLRELGPGVIASLDHALFEVNPKTMEGLAYLGPREHEALRCAGLIMTDHGDWVLVVSEHVTVLKEVMAELISSTTSPPFELQSVTEGLWFVERVIRAEVRKAAVAKWGEGWRNSVLGNLSSEVLRRAQLDSSIASTKIGELRDPLEWVTLGELVDIVQSDKFSGLDKSPVLWRRLQEQLVPVRNRVAHVRMLKALDEETVATWVSAVRTWF